MMNIMNLINIYYPLLNFIIHYLVIISQIIYGLNLTLNNQPLIQLHQPINGIILNIAMKKFKLLVVVVPHVKMIYRINPLLIVLCVIHQ